MMKKSAIYVGIFGIAILGGSIASISLPPFFSRIKSDYVAAKAAKELAATACVSVPDGRVLPIANLKVPVRTLGVLRQWTDQSGKAVLTGTVYTVDGRTVEYFDGSQVTIASCPS
jgi:hypothetical protein